MQDERNSFDGWAASLRRVRRMPGEGGVIDFASWVVALLAARRTAADTVVRTDLLAELVGAASDRSEARLSAFLRELVREKVSPATIADLYIPAAATQLGEDWMDDRIGFAEVTLASARLQAMLRAIGASWSADAQDLVDCGCILLCVPPQEQHTLGALVLMGQLRRSGVSVRLALGLQPEEVAGLFAAIRFDGIFLSVAGSGHLAQVARYVESLRALGPPGLPVVIGGGILRAVPQAALALGADLAAWDIGQALSACAIGQDEQGRVRRRA